MPAPRSRGARQSSIGVSYDTRELRRFTWALGRGSETFRRAEQTFYRASAATVAAMAESRARMEGGVAAKSASDIRALANAVQYGGKPYSMGAEFGSYRYKQFKTWRGNGDDAGYFLWPAVRTFRDKDFLNKWTREVWDAVRNDIL